MHKTSREYWDAVWKSEHRVAAIEPGKPRAMGQFDRAFDAAIRTALARWGERPRNMIELGCGGSPYLPYFVRHHGLVATGLDYSQDGCALARTVLAQQNATADIVQGDMLDPPAGLMGRFDIVFSVGLLEHFADTSGAIAAARRFLRPGGLMISIIPNMRGLPGWLQRRLDRRIFDIHVALDTGSFAAAHRAVGMEVLQSDYLMDVNLYVLRYRNEASAFGLALRLVRAGLMRVLWHGEYLTGWTFPNPVTSPYLICAAR